MAASLPAFPEQKTEELPDLDGEKVIAEAAFIYSVPDVRSIESGTGVFGPSVLINSAPFRLYVFPRLFFC